MKTDKKILIVGGSGFIGYHLQKALENRKLVNMDLHAPDFSPSGEFRRGDIRSEQDLKKIITPGEFDTIINLAAEHKDFGVSRQGYFATNEGGSRNLVDAAEKAGVKRIVFYSSVAVYGTNSLPSHETMSTAPSNFYGQSKLAAEQVFKAWAEKDPTRAVVIIRPAVVYGERNFANVYRLIKQIKSGWYFTIGRGNNVKSMAYVKNLVAATAYLIEHMQAGVNIFNYADEPHLTTREIGKNIAEALGKGPPISLPFSILIALALPFDLLIKITGRDLPVSTSRIKKLCTPTHHLATKIREAGFNPAVDNENGLKNMVIWMESYEKNNNS